MQIAQSSVNIDENAKLAGDAQNHSDENKKKTESFMKGKITRSPLSPQEADDHNPHQDGDMWTKVNEQTGVALDMWQFKDGKWQPTKWDAQSMNVKKLSTLSEDAGEINAGTINGVQLNGVEINVDIDGNSGAHDSGHNWLTWTAPDFTPNNPSNGNYYGFHFRNGLMSFKGYRTGSSNGSAIGSTDALYIGPNDLKLRNTPNADAGYVNNRVDIRSNYIEIGNDFTPPSTGGYGGGVGLYPDGSAVISNHLYSKNADFTGDVNVDRKVSAYNIDTDNWLSAGKLTVSGEVHLPNFNAKVPESLVVNDVSNFFRNWYVTEAGWYNGEGVTVSHSVQGTQFIPNSTVSVKRDISSLEGKDALRNILSTDIYKFKYKSDNSEYHYGPIIDDENEIDNSDYNVSNNIVASKKGNKVGYTMNDAVGMLIGSVHELSNQNEKLLSRILQLEMTKNGNN